MHMHTRLKNGALLNGQQPGSVVNILIDHGKVKAMRMLRGHRGLCCGKHQRASMKDEYASIEVGIVHIILKLILQQHHSIYLILNSR